MRHRTDPESNLVGKAAAPTRKDSLEPRYSGGLLSAWFGSVSLGQLKLKDCAPLCSGQDRDFSAVRLDDRAADRKSHAHATRFGREQWVKDAVKVRDADALATVLDG